MHGGWLHEGQVFPDRAVVLSDVFVAVAGTISLQALGSQFHQIAATQANNLDEMEARFLLGAGTYTFRAFVRTGNTHGIAEFKLDGVDLMTPQDLYAASVTNNVILVQAGIVVTGGGAHLLRIKTNGKNASSTGYDRHVTSCSFTP